MEKLTNKDQQHNTNNPKFSLKLAVPLTLFITIVSLQIFKNISLQKPPNISHASYNSYVKVEQYEANVIEKATPITRTKSCDLFEGEWVPNPAGPYYTNGSCSMIPDYQNCIKFGRFDTEYMRWRWKPDGCELPIFDPHKFLEIVKGKSLAFVGDSVARNHMQSLLCLLSQVEQPVDVSFNKTDWNLKRWKFASYNFTIAKFWSPFLVKTQGNDPHAKPGVESFGLVLDEPNEAWKTQITDFDYVIISAGHWFFRTHIYYYNNDTLVGCRHCGLDNLTDYTLSYAYKNAFRTAFRAILDNEGFKGVVYLRTFAPEHYEGGGWGDGGDCPRKKPFKRGEINLEGENMEMYMAQMEAFKEAQKLAQLHGPRFEVMDMTRVMLMRSDGHPSKHGRPPNSPRDCVHWCLPGPIDSWNDFLLEMIKG